MRIVLFTIILSCSLCAKAQISDVGISKPLFTPQHKMENNDTAGREHPNKVIDTPKKSEVNSIEKKEAITNGTEQKNTIISPLSPAYLPSPPTKADDIREQEMIRIKGKNNTNPESKEKKKE